MQVLVSSMCASQYRRGGGGEREGEIALMMAGMTLSMVLVMTRKLYMSSFLATLAPIKVKMDMMLCNTRPFRKEGTSCD